MFRYGVVPPLGFSVDNVFLFSTERDGNRGAKNYVHGVAAGKGGRSGGLFFTQHADEEQKGMFPGGVVIKAEVCAGIIIALKRAQRGQDLRFRLPLGRGW